MRTLAPRISLISAAVLGLLAPCATAHAADGSFRVRGYVHYDVRRYDEELPGSPGDGSETRRFRPIFEYKSDLVSARFMPDLQRDTNQTLDAYLDFTPDAAWDLRVGRFKTPLSLNRLQSSGAVVPMEASVVASMTPNRDNGILLGWDAVPGWRIEAGAFDGAADDVVKGSLDSGVEWVARVVHSRTAGGGKLRLAAGASAGEREGAPGDARLARYRTPGRATWFRYVGDAHADGSTGRAILSADYQRGPLFLQAEAVESRADVRAGATSASLSHHAWEVVGAYTLTGEDRTERGVTPGNWKLPGLELPVAVEVGGHFGHARVDADAFRLGLASTANSGEAYQSAGVSVSFWFPKQWRLTLDYEQGTLDGFGGAADRKERALLARVAVGF